MYYYVVDANIEPYKQEDRMGFRIYQFSVIFSVLLKN